MFARQLTAAGAQQVDERSALQVTSPSRSPLQSHTPLWCAAPGMSIATKIKAKR
jgi:hypothetical protein